MKLQSYTVRLTVQQAPPDSQVVCCISISLYFLLPLLPPFLAPLVTFFSSGTSTLSRAVADGIFSVHNLTFI